MNITIKIELGNEGMQSRYDVFQAIRRSLLVVPAARLAPMLEGEKYPIADANGNTVGGWEVTS